MEYTDTDVRGLGDKLDGLPLSTGERHALTALIGFAARHPSDLDGLQEGAFAPVLHQLLFEPALA